jgi:hypothetical protein
LLASLRRSIPQRCNEHRDFLRCQKPAVERGVCKRPSTYRAYSAQRRDPTTGSTRAKRDAIGSRASERQTGKLTQSHRHGCGETPSALAMEFFCTSPYIWRPRVGQYRRRA